MTPSDRVDVLVVGAGPAGAVAAAGLARHGMAVLLADAGAGLPSRGSRSFGLLLSGPAVRGLEALGLLGSVPVRPVESIDLRFGSRSRRVIAGAGAAACDSAVLRRGLPLAAAGAGARLVPGAVTALTRLADGYHAVIDLAGGPVTVTARHVVVAAGSAVSGGLAVGGGRDTEARQASGVSCVQRFRGGEPGRQMVLALPAPVTTHPDEQLGCAWALPDGDGTLTIGTASVRGGDQAGPGGPERPLATALRTLTEADPRFAALRPAGPLLSGPLDTGFSPARVKGAGLLLAGDAAGLVNPFTGEGLSYAVQSGTLAARAISAHPADPDAALRMYARSLTAAFVGYFETARHSARRYHLAWRVLAAAAESDHPFFAKGRRAILLPDGFGGLGATERMDLAIGERAMLGPFLVACDEVAISTVRREWPFLARLVLAGENLTERRLRPAALFFAALMAAGTAPVATRATLGAALELAMLGSLALLGPLPPPSAGRGVDWALASCVMAGDFLLAQASRLVAESAPEVSWSFADWLGELAALRAGRLAGQPGVPAGDLYASMLEFPARIGAQLGGAPPETIAALRSFGRDCGHAFLHAEDLLALRGERTRLDASLAVMLHGQLSGIPCSLGRAGVSEQDLAGQDLRSAALAAARAGCETARRRALDVLAAVPDASAASILREFVRAVAAPAAAADRSYPEKAAVPSGVPQPVGPS